MLSSTGGAAPPHPAVLRASLRARPVLRSSGLQIGRPLQDLTVAAIKASWTKPDAMPKAKDAGEATLEANRCEGVAPMVENARGTFEDAHWAPLIAEARLAPSDPTAKNEDAKNKAPLRATEDCALQKSARLLLARMLELHAASAPMHAHACAFASALGPFVRMRTLDDADAPDALKDNNEAPASLRMEPGAGAPPLPRLAQALLALDACFHRSCKAHGFVASYSQWHSEVRRSHACAPSWYCIYNEEHLPHAPCAPRPAHPPRCCAPRPAHPPRCRLASENPRRVSRPRTRPRTRPRWVHSPAP